MICLQYRLLVRMLLVRMLLVRVLLVRQIRLRGEFLSDKRIHCP